MKNQQKPLLSRRAVSGIFALVAIVTLSGYGLEPIPVKKTEPTHKTAVEASNMAFSWSLPSLDASSKGSAKPSQPSQIVAKKQPTKPVVKPLVKKAIKSNQEPIISNTLVFQPMDKTVNTVGPVAPDLTDEEKSAKIRAYFGKYNLPLAQHAEKFVEISHYCDIDWALLPAIGMQESTGGKFTQLNNPFGWASARIGFKDFDEAIEVVGGHLCGLYDSTDQYYKDKNTAQKLWHYNGSVNHRYTGEVIAIMSKIKTMPIATPLAME